MTRHAATTDPEIRSALHRKRFRRLKSQPDTLVIDELGLAHARSRIDVAVINGCIHGYEIKSGKDSLARLARQIGIYSQTLQKVTIVTASSHLGRVLAAVPSWCGVLEAELGPKGGISFNAIRSARSNPDMDPVMMAHLLWRSEVLRVLSRLGYAPKELRCPRRKLYEMLSDALSPGDITAAIRTAMVQRQAWRDHPAHG